MLVPSFGALYLAVTLLFPFVAIRTLSHEKETGALRLLVQLPYRVPTLVVAKVAAISIAWLISIIPLVSVLIIWIVLGGHLYAPETLNLLLGHLLYGLLVGAIAWVIDLDLEKFFDRVNHDKLMGQIAKRVEDKRLLKLIRVFLNAGVMENGLVSPSVEGTPQGGPLSPLLSNLVLDELDQELECRGHRFVRYADDCNIYVRSERAGHRVMESISRFITQKLKLKVNEAKSAVARPQERKFLGFSFTAGPDIKRMIAPKSLERFKRRIRDITQRVKGVSMKTTMEELAPYMRGWRNYFGFCETPEVLVALTRWVRLRLRAALWRQWKTPRRRRAALIALQVFGQLCNTADSGRGPWYIARSKALSLGLSNAYFRSLGLPSLFGAC